MKVPNTDLGAKAVDDDVPNKLPLDDVFEVIPKDPNPMTLSALDTNPKALVGLEALANSPPVTEADVPSAEVSIVVVD